MAKERMIVDGRGIDKDAKNPHADRDRKVIENLKISYGIEAETAHRFYEGPGFMPMKSREKDVSSGMFEYVPCPAPVKIDKNAGWEPENCERCNVTVPARLKGKAARIWMIAHHMSEHAEEWIERNSIRDDKNRGGAMRPPNSTRVEFNRWAVDADDVRSQEMTDFERALHKQMSEMEHSKRSKATMEAVNEKKKKEKADLNREREKMIVESESE